MTFFTIESLLLVLGLIVLYRYFLHKKWQYFAERNIPTDKPSILKMGTIAGATGQKIFHIDLERKQRLGPVFGVYAGWNPRMVIFDLDIMRQIYTKEFKNFPDRQTITKLNGKNMNHGLTTVSGEKWKRIRATISPTFTISKLKQVFSIADECATQTIAVIHKKCDIDEGRFTPRMVFSNLSLDMIVSAALGTKANPQVLDGEETRLSRELRKTFNTGFFSYLGFSLRMTRDEIVGNAMLIVGAGFENIANSMVFLAYNLAFHPDVQEKLQQEVDAVVAEKGGFDYEAINTMKYLDMCLNESLRLYNPLVGNGRICRKETTINGLTIPKGMAISIPAFALSHDPEYWENPWEFIPDRMEDMSKIDPMLVQTFGAGPRNCIGLRFALMELKITFKLMQNFTFKPCDDTPKPPLKLAFGISVRPLEQFSLRAVPRGSM